MPKLIILNKRLSVIIAAVCSANSENNQLDLVKLNPNKLIEFSSPLKMSQSINVKQHDYDRNDKDIGCIFYESKKIFACLIKSEMVNLKKKTGW